jgi:hypothetical protein
MPSR